MKVSPQPRASALFRVFAGTCALLWLVGTAVWDVEGVCNCASHEGASAAHASPVHEHDAVSAHEQGHSPDAEHHLDAEVCQDATASDHYAGAPPQPSAGKNGSKCGCSTIQALTMTMTPDVISKPVSQPVLNFSLLCAVRQHVFAAPPSETLRRAKPRNWVFTPVVCLGPAFRNLAPPAFV